MKHNDIYLAQLCYTRQRYVSEKISVIYVRRENEVRSSMSLSSELDALASAARHLSVVVLVNHILSTDSLVD